MERYADFLYEKLLWVMEVIVKGARFVWNFVKDDPATFFTKMLLIMLIVGGVSVVYYLFEMLLELFHNRRIERKLVLLEILPKETVKIKETESLIRNIHSLLLNTKWRKWLYGRPYMSFEVVAEKDRIKFYVKVPEGYKKVLQERIYSTYSEVAIREVKDDYFPKRVWRTPKDIIVFLYSLITYPVRKKPFKWPKNYLNIYGTEMELAFHHVFKLKTNQDRDLLPSILAGMKDLEWHEKVVVQILARPLDNKWQLKGRSVLERFERNGKRPKRGNDFVNFLNSLADQFVDMINYELEQSGYKKKKSNHRKTRMERKEITVASEKLLEPGFETVIRVMAVGHYKRANKSRVKAITSAFSELDKENRFKRDFILAKKLFYRRTRNRRIYLIDRKNILTTSELANFFLRLPGTELLDEFQDIEALRIKEFAPPKNVETKKNIIAVNTYRGKETLIGIKDHDLKRHVVVQGKTGSGKSEWAKTFMKQLMEQGRGFMLLEPHGKLADEILELVPEDRIEDVVYFDLYDSHPPAFNFCKIFDRKGRSREDEVEKTTSEVIEIFKRIFREAWSEKNENYLTNALKTLLEVNQGNINDIQRLFKDKEYRKHIISQLKDPQLKQFWETEFAEKNGRLSPGTESTVSSLAYKLDKFLNKKKLLRAVAQDDCIDFKEILDNNKIVIFRFSKDNMSEDMIKFIGGIAIKLLIVAAFARDKAKWNDVYPVFIDECHNFISENIKTVMYELRKYGVPFILMHQVLEQFSEVPGLKEAIYGNVGNKITFTVGRDDAKFFAEEYGPRVDERDLTGLPSRYGYCKILVDGEESNTFNIYTLDRPEVSKAKGRETVFKIKKLNRAKRMHYKEIDKMLEEKINNYRDIDESEQEIEDSFVQDLSEEYVKGQEIEEIEKNSKLELDNEGDYDIKVNPLGTEIIEAKVQDIEIEDLEIEIEISYDELVQSNEKEKTVEKTDVKKQEEVKLETKESNKVLKLRDFFEKEDLESNLAVATLEENANKEREVIQNNAQKIWGKAAQKEKEILNAKGKEDKDDNIGRKLWEIAAKKEKGGEY